MATLMRDIYQVLYSKERQLERLRREVEVLKIVIPLLQDDSLSVIPFERARIASRRSPSALSD